MKLVAWFQQVPGLTPSRMPSLPGKWQAASPQHDEVRTKTGQVLGARLAEHFDVSAGRALTGCRITETGACVLRTVTGDCAKLCVAIDA